VTRVYILISTEISGAEISSQYDIITRKIGCYFKYDIKPLMDKRSRFTFAVYEEVNLNNTTKFFVFKDNILFSKQKN
jgi:hypothetical protein